jgi:hypothetical protein
VACNENQKATEETFSTEIETTESLDTLSMNQYTSEGHLTVQGEQYSYSYQFAPSDSLPLVTTSLGQKHYDNQIILKINKSGNTIFSHTFTKKSFKRFIPDDLYDSYVLTGFNINYNKENKQDKFYFVSSVGDTDDLESYIPIDITITAKGELSLDKFIDTDISKENIVDEGA